MAHKRRLSGFTMFDLVLLAMMASLGIASKPVITPLVHIITGPLYIPGGVVAGGFYMLWVVLGAGLVDKRGSATLLCIVQAVMIVAIGIYGTHGLISFATYILPGIAVDLVFLAFGRYRLTAAGFFSAGIAANMAGSYLVNLVFFRLPLVPLILSLSCAALSGGLGGLIAYTIVKKLRTMNFPAFAENWRQ